MKETTFENLQIGDIFKFNSSDKSSYIKISNTDLDKCIVKKDSQQILALKKEASSIVYKVSESGFNLPEEEKMKELEIFNNKIKNKIINLIEVKKLKYIEELEKEYHFTKNENWLPKKIRNSTLSLFIYLAISFLTLYFNIFNLKENFNFLLIFVPFSITFLFFILYKIFIYIKIHETINSIKELNFENNNDEDLLKDIMFIERIKQFHFYNISFELLYPLNKHEPVFVSEDGEEQDMKILTYFFKDKEILDFINNKGQFNYVKILEKTFKLEYEFKMKKKVNNLY